LARRIFLAELASVPLSRSGRQFSLSVLGSSAPLGILDLALGFDRVVHRLPETVRENILLDDVI
jgi:hypothetical protein